MNNILMYSKDERLKLRNILTKSGFFEKMFDEVCRREYYYDLMAMDNNDFNFCMCDFAHLIVMIRLWSFVHLPTNIYKNETQKNKSSTAR